MRLALARLAPARLAYLAFRKPKMRQTLRLKMPVKHLAWRLALIGAMKAKTKLIVGSTLACQRQADQVLLVLLRAVLAALLLKILVRVAYKVKRPEQLAEQMQTKQTMCLEMLGLPELAMLLLLLKRLPKPQIPLPKLRIPLRLRIRQVLDRLGRRLAQHQAM